MAVLAKSRILGQSGLLCARLTSANVTHGRLAHLAHIPRRVASDLLTRRCPCGRPDPFRTVRDLGRVRARCSCKPGGARDDGGMPSTSDTYLHGHHDSVLRSHRWRTAENSAGYLLARLAPGARVLDVGCGPGTITVDLACRVPAGQVTGLHAAADVLALARQEADRRGPAHPAGPAAGRAPHRPCDESLLAAPT